MVGAGLAAYQGVMSMFERAVRALAAGVLGLALFAAPPALAGPKRPVVVELYTSQGSSACPPADALLGQLSNNRDILTMSFPITYWDMLGWRDTFGTDANNRRQKAYSTFMGRGGVYTPQIIVDGVNDIVGNRDGAVWAAVSARAADMTVVPVALSATPTQIHISIGAGGDKAPKEATIWLFHILSKGQANVTTGENAGRQLTYRNIVREIRAIGTWKGQALTIDLPRRELSQTQHDSVAVVVQQGGYGRVLGASMLARPDYGSN